MPLLNKTQGRFVVAALCATGNQHGIVVKVMVLNLDNYTAEDKNFQVDFALKTCFIAP